MKNSIKIFIRICLVPCILPIYIVGYAILTGKAVYLWVVGGGEIITWGGKEKATIAAIYDELKKKNEFSAKLIEISKKTDEAIEKDNLVINP